VVPTIIALRKQDRGSPERVGPVWSRNDLEQQKGIEAMSQAMINKISRPDHFFEEARGPSGQQTGGLTQKAQPNAEVEAEEDS
jgi:hypothetical protein